MSDVDPRQGAATSGDSRVSVIVVSYNGRRVLAQGLQSLEPLRGQWHEVLVVDNGSEDGSQEMVRREFHWVRLIELGKNLGFGVANNRGAAAAQGDRFLFLNSDAWLHQEALPRLNRSLDDDAEIGLVAPQLYYPDGGLQFTWAPTTGVVGEAIQMVRNRFESKPWAHRLPPTFLRPLLGPGWLTAACWLMRREAFEQADGFDEAIFLYFEDVDLSLRLKHCGWTLRFEPEATAFHIKGASELGFRGEMLYRRSQLYYYEKHRPAWEQALLRRRLRRKFARHREAGERRQLLELLDG